MKMENDKLIETLKRVPKLGVHIAGICTYVVINVVLKL